MPKSRKLVKSAKRGKLARSKKTRRNRRQKRKTTNRRMKGGENECVHETDPNKFASLEDDVCPDGYYLKDREHGGAVGGGIFGSIASAVGYPSGPGTCKNPKSFTDTWDNPRLYTTNTYCLNGDERISDVKQTGTRKSLKEPPGLHFEDSPNVKTYNIIQDRVEDRNF